MKTQGMAFPSTLIQQSGGRKVSLMEQTKQKAIAVPTGDKTTYKGETFICLRKDIERLVAMVKSRDQEIEGLRVALEFYANDKNWENDSVDIGVGVQEIPGSCEVNADGGRRAKDVLSLKTASGTAPAIPSVLVVMDGEGSSKASCRAGR